jgi:serine/threonine-protein kinase
VAGEQGWPLEVRALHAFAAQDAFEALLMLEQVGDLNLSRDDIDGAVLAFRRGLDLARREIFRGELDDPMRAVLIFGRKLGESLNRAGDLMDADGVLREALDAASASGEDRAKVLFALARVSKSRRRETEAMRYLREAIELAHQSGAHDLMASLEETSRAWT